MKLAITPDQLFGNTFCDSTYYVPFTTISLDNKEIKGVLSIVDTDDTINDAAHFLRMLEASLAMNGTHGDDFQQAMGHNGYANVISEGAVSLEDFNRLILSKEYYTEELNTEIYNF